MINGVNGVWVLNSNVTCTDISYEEMRQALLANIRVTRQTLIVIVDESTMLSKKPCFNLYLRISFDNSEPLTTLDLLEQENMTTEGITSELLNYPLKYCLDGVFLKNV